LKDGSKNEVNPETLSPDIPQPYLLSPFRLSARSVERRQKAYDGWRGEVRGDDGFLTNLAPAHV
jgi:hypothetical protein